MKINSRIQIPFSQLKGIPIDLIITSSGYEARSTFIAQNLNLREIKQKIVLAFSNENQTINRSSNDLFFTHNSFLQILADSDTEDEIFNYLSEHLIDGKEEFNIVIDYSSMTRIWYSSILKYFFYNQSLESKVNLFFCYAIAKFIPSPKENAYNLHIGPIRGFSNLTVPQKPTALIIGLGYEKSRAWGLNEYFDGETFAFYTDNVKEPKYSQEVEKNNSVLLSELKPENICRYSINDLSSLYSTLFSLTKDLSSSYRVIIASCGPKPFTLISLIIALERRDIDAWRISAGKGAIPVDKIAEGEIAVFKVCFDNGKE